MEILQINAGILCKLSLNRPNERTRKNMNLHTSFRELFNGTKPKLPPNEEHEETEEPIEQETEKLYLAIPAPVSGIPLVLALVLGSLGNLQSPRGGGGAGGGLGGGWTPMLVFGSRGGRLAASCPLPPVQGLPGWLSPSGRF